MIKRSLYLALGAIIVMNAVLLIRIGDLNNRMESLSHSYNNLQSRISSVTFDVNQSLNQFIREQSWISAVQIDYDRTLANLEHSKAVVSWQLKDFQEGAEVTFHYRQQSNAEYQTIRAEAGSTGLFEVQVPLEVKPGPVWDVQSFGPASGEAPQRAVEIKAPPAHQSIQCYISVKTGNNIKSSEMSFLDLSDVASWRYEPVRGHIENNKNHYSITLFADGSGQYGFESITATFYNGEQIVAEKPVAVRQDEIRQYPDRAQPPVPRDHHLSYDAGTQTITRVVLSVKYENGEQFSYDIM